MRRLVGRVRCAGRERGSTIPLILGFFVVGFLVVSGAVAAGSAFTSQRDLQSVCDGAALAAANSADLGVVRGGGVLGRSLPLARVRAAVDDYLGEDPARSAVTAAATVSATGSQVQVTCARRTKVALAGAFGVGSGVVEHATSVAESAFG